MKCGKTNLCEVREIKGRYTVTWNTHITGLDVYSEKVYILLEMIVKDCKSWEVGILLSSGHVLWLSHTLIASSIDMDEHMLGEYIRRAGQAKDHREITGAVFDNTDDVEKFVDRLEKKYIVHLLKA